MAMENWRLSKIQEELEKLDLTADNTQNRGDNAQTGNIVYIKDTLARGGPVVTVGNFAGDEGYSDDEESLPPYPDIEDDSVIHDYGDFPTPVPAQIGIVRPLPGLTKQQAPPPEDIYSETCVKPIKETFDEAQAAQLFTEKYDSIGKVKPIFELAKIPDGYINMNSPTKAAPKRVAPPPPPLKITKPASQAHGRLTSDKGPSFSEIIQIRSPARAMAMSYEQQIPPVIPEQQQSSQQLSPTIPEQIQSPKRGSRELSWTEMDTRSSPSKGVLPTDLTGFQNSSIMKTGTGCSSSLNEHDILQVEMFYRSHKTQVFVSQCMADLYYGSMKNTSPNDNFYSSGLDSLSNWKLIKPGIPVLLLDSGESRRERRMYLVMAERGTGFALWKDQFNHLTDYQAREALFHTMHLSTDHSKLAAFKFHDAVGATDFLQKIKSVLTSPEMEDILNLSDKKKKKEKKKQAPKSKKKLPNKAAISAPCCFTHITNLDRNDGLGVLDLAATATAKEGNS